MVGDYRYRIPGGREPEVTVQGMVKFEVFVEVCTEEDPDVWEMVAGGHFDVLISGDALEVCSTALQAKRFIAQDIADRGLCKSDRAWRALYALLPGGVWPETDVTQPIEMEG